MDLGGLPLAGPVFPNILRIWGGLDGTFNGTLNPDYLGSVPEHLKLWL